MHEPGEAQLGHTYLHQLIRHELALAKLYAAFAASLPSHADFWNKFVCEEQAHAEVLEELQRWIGKNRIRFKRAQFNLDQVYESLEYLAVATRNAQAGRFNPGQALECAGNLEQSILEHSFFTVFAEDTDEIKKEFEALRRHTRMHADLMKQALQVWRRTTENNQVKT